MRPGQTVGFRVDAFPTETFHGSVAQVRLQPTVVQNVVVYSTVIAVPNQQLKLKPGMTANVNIEIARRNDALRVPAAAVRFRPTEAMFQVLNQEVPPEVLRGAGGRGGFGGRRGAGNGQPAEGWQPGGQPGAATPATPPAAGAPAAKPTPSAAATPAPAQQAQAAPPAAAADVHHQQRRVAAATSRMQLPAAAVVSAAAAAVAAGSTPT